MKRLAIACFALILCVATTGCCICCPSLSEDSPLSFLGRTTTTAAQDEAGAVATNSDTDTKVTEPVVETPTTEATEDVYVPVETTTTPTTTRIPGITYKEVKPYRIPIANPNKDIYDAPDGNLVDTFGTIGYYTIVEQATDTKGYTWGRLSDSDMWTLIYKEILPDLALYYSSGIGSWYSALNLSGDGTFSGNYYDMDLGDWDTDYVNGTCYASDFSGSFRVDDIDGTTITLVLTNLETALTPETTWIEDDVRYIAGFAYGLDGGTTFYLYTPYTLVEDLPEEVRAWNGISSYGYLNRYVLYCPTINSIFIG